MPNMKESLSLRNVDFVSVTSEVIRLTTAVRELVNLKLESAARLSWIVITHAMVTIMNKHIHLVYMKAV